MKLCLFKVGKSDACIRPLFANLVTYSCSTYISRLTVVSREAKKKEIFDARFRDYSQNSAKISATNYLS